MTDLYEIIVRVPLSDAIFDRARELIAVEGREEKVRELFKDSAAVITGALVPAQAGEGVTRKEPKPRRPRVVAVLPVVTHIEGVRASDPIDPGTASPPPASETVEQPAPPPTTRVRHVRGEAA